MLSATWLQMTSKDTTVSRRTSFVGSTPTVTEIETDDVDQWIINFDVDALGNFDNRPSLMKAANVTTHYAGTSADPCFRSKDSQHVHPVTSVHRLSSQMLTRHSLRHDCSSTATVAPPERSVPDWTSLNMSQGDIEYDAEPCFLSSLVTRLTTMA